MLMTLTESLIFTHITKTESNHFCVVLPVVSKLLYYYCVEDIETYLLRVSCVHVYKMPSRHNA